MMKKMGTVLLALIMIFSVTACGGKKTETPVVPGPLKDLYDQGYDYTSAVGEENVFAAMYEKEDGDTVYGVKVTIAQDQLENYAALDWGDEDFSEKLKAFLLTQQDVKIVDLAEFEPEEGYFDSYIGKTFGDLENEGYEDTGYWLGEDAPCFSYEGPYYNINVTTDLAIPDSDAMDNYSRNDIRGFVITGVEYCGLSSMLLEKL